MSEKNQLNLKSSTVKIKSNASNPDQNSVKPSKPSTIQY